MCLTFELLRKNSFRQIAAGIEQRCQSDIVGFDHIDPSNFPEFLVIGDRVHRA